MKITKEWLKSKSACEEGRTWWLKNKESDVKKLVKKLIKAEQYQWGNWLLSRVFTHTQNIKYAIFAAEQVIEIYEKKYPNDDRPRKAIEAAKAYLNNPNEANKNAVNAAYAAANAYAADAADAAAYAAYAANAAVNAAYAAANAYAANAANAYAAYAANAYAAYAAYAAANAADAADAADAAKKEVQVKILNYGLTLLQEVNK